MRRLLALLGCSVYKEGKRAATTVYQLAYKAIKERLANANAEYDGVLLDGEVVVESAAAENTNNACKNRWGGGVHERRMAMACIAGAPWACQAGMMRCGTRWVGPPVHHTCGVPCCLLFVRLQLRERAAVRLQPGQDKRR